MNSASNPVGVVGALATALLLMAVAPPPTNAGVIPLILIDDVPLRDAIANLARQMDLNCILDPHVPGAGFGPGSRMKSPSVSIRLENRTADEALGRVLKQHKLALVTNAATTVARIVPIASAPKTPPGAASPDTNAAIPALNLDGISLTQAIESLAGAAKLRVSFDRKFTESEYGRDSAMLFLRWKNLSARQALAALVENYDLVMTEDAATRSVRIALRAPGESAAPGTAKPKGRQP